jgi:hypothetical protein
MADAGSDEDYEDPNNYNIELAPKKTDTVPQKISNPEPSNTT